MAARNCRTRRREAEMKSTRPAPDLSKPRLTTSAMIASIASE
ncbi:MAG: transketolase family protein, partial [Bradyrhizobium sp.]